MQNIAMQNKNKGAARPDPAARAARRCAVGLAVLLAAALFLRFGYSRSQVGLDITQGDAAALAGFTLSGRSSGNAAGVDWLLCDGSITTKAALDTRREAEPDYAATSVLALRPQDRDAAEQAANRSLYNSGGGADLAEEYQTQTNSAFKVLRVSLNVQDSEERRSIRFPYAELTDRDEAIFWVAAVHQSRTGDASQAWGSDYVGSETADTTAYAYSAFRFVCSDGVWYYTVSAFDNSLVTPGLYRVDKALTNAEIAALPCDAAAGGVPVLANSTAYGKTTLLYAFGSGSDVSGVQAMPDGGVCVLLAQDTETGDDRQEKLLFFDGDGRLTDEAVVFASGADGKERRAELLQNQRADEVAVVMQDGADSAAVTVLRVADGKVTHSAAVPLTAEQFTVTALRGGGYDWFNRVDTAAMSEDAARILLTERQYETFRYDQENSGVLYQAEETIEPERRALTVYDASGGEILLTASLDPGSCLTRGARSSYFGTSGSTQNRWIANLTCRGTTNGFFDTPARRAAAWPDAEF